MATVVRRRANNERLRWLGDRCGICDEVDDRGLGTAANVELRERCRGAQRRDAHANGLQRVRCVDDDRPELSLVVEE
jgi:hypothetical protein